MRTQHNDPNATSVGLQILAPPENWEDRTQLGPDQDAEDEDAEVDDIPWDEDEQQRLFWAAAPPAHTGGFDPQPDTSLFTAEQQAFLDAQPPLVPDTFSDSNLSVEDPNYCWECLFMLHGEYCPLHTPSY